MLTRRMLIFAAGSAFALAGTAALAGVAKELMGTRVVHWSETRPAGSGDVTWRVYFDAPTSTLLNLGLRATTLAPGATPHPVRPHSRPIESVLIVKEGTLEVTLGDRDPKVVRLEPGSAVFLSSNQWHALRNPGKTPVTYYELDWISPGMNGERQF